jgi:hypothetical protein
MCGIYYSYAHSRCTALHIHTLRVAAEQEGRGKPTRWVQAVFIDALRDAHILCWCSDGENDEAVARRAGVSVCARVCVRERNNWLYLSVCVVRTALPDTLKITYYYSLTQFTRARMV